LILRLILRLLPGEMTSLLRRCRILMCVSPMIVVVVRVIRRR